MLSLQALVARGCTIHSLGADRKTRCFTSLIHGIRRSVNLSPTKLNTQPSKEMVTKNASAKKTSVNNHQIANSPVTTLILALHQSLSQIPIPIRILSQIPIPIRILILILTQSLNPTLALTLIQLLPLLTSSVQFQKQSEETLTMTRRIHPKQPGRLMKLSITSRKNFTISKSPSSMLDICDVSDTNKYLIIIKTLMKYFIKSTLRKVRNCLLLIQHFLKTLLNQFSWFFFYKILTIFLPYFNLFLIE